MKSHHPHTVTTTYDYRLPIRVKCRELFLLFFYLLFIYYLGLENRIEMHLSFQLLAQPCRAGIDMRRIALDASNPSIS